MPTNNRNNNNHPSNMGGYGGQGVKRMRSDDPRHDNMSSAHRMKWDTGDDDNNNASFLERNDIDQRSEYATMIGYALKRRPFLIELLVNLQISP
jgi:hypothetical protein